MKDLRIVALLSQFAGASASLAQNLAQTTYGAIQGFSAFNSTPAGNISNWEDVVVWKGIPYAASTGGQNRFRSPQPRAAWNTTLIADSFGPGCPASQGESATVDEDCLYLNVWSAANTTDDKLPVILWSHPAGGSSADGLFDGGGMAAKGVIFVNYNYRDGAFGWLATPELSEEFYNLTGSNSSGNWGLLDMYAALKWVYANIEAFGGDPTKITAVGQSAGSAATYHMVNSDLVKGLIRGAIAESGIRDPRDPLASSLAESYNNLTSAITLGEAFLADNNVSTIAELREIPLANLTGYTSAPGSGSGFRPVLDYYAIPAKYAETLLTGPANDVPLITGNTRDESGASYSLTSLNVSTYISEMTAQYGNLTARALALYPAANETQAATSYNTMWQDTSRVSSWGYGNGWHKTSKSPFYTYFWDHAPPGQSQGAYHESEINYVFNNLYATDLPWEDVDYEIAEKMSSYWANFAKTLDPNNSGSYEGDEELAYWSPNLVNGTVTQELGDGFQQIPIADAAKIQLLQDYFNQQVPF